ncbi:MAG: DUF2807 domain-containing protein [Bacteroidales bacterium]|nr:DUF2807 domain-containing protein [Bacteroidales bacterium]
MKINRLYIIIVCLLILILPGCAKEGGQCPTSTGKERYEERNIISEFDSVYLYGNMNLHITEGPVFRLYVYAGENLLPGILTGFSGKRLRIEDVNSCDYIRDLNPKMDVYLTLPKLKYLEFSSSGTISATNTLTSDSLAVQCWSGGGSLKMDIRAKECWFIEHTGAVDFTVSGVCPNTYIYHTGYAPFDFKNLKAERVHVVNRSSNHSYVNASKFLGAELWNLGNIYYIGSPEEIKIENHGKGRLIPFQP